MFFCRKKPSRSTARRSCFMCENTDEKSLIGFFSEFDCSAEYRKLRYNTGFNYQQVVRQPIGKLLFRKFCENECEQFANHIIILILIETIDCDKKTNRRKLQTELSEMFPSRKTLQKNDRFLADSVLDLMTARNPDSSYIKRLVNYIHLRMATEAFPKFQESNYFEQFLQFKSLETNAGKENGYVKGKFMCTGTTADVYVCTSKITKTKFAGKYIKKSTIAAKHLERSVLYEKQILEQLNSRFVIELFCAFETEESLCLITNLMSGGDLYRHIHLETDGEGLGFDRARFYAAEIICGLLYLHSKNIIHLDVKPENILIDRKGHVRIGDLGVATMLRKDEKMKAWMGTKIYMAPEILKGEFYDMAVDWFSFGCIVYEMIEGVNPFERLLRTQPQVPVDTLITAGEPEYTERFSNSSRQLCMQLMQKVPEHRMLYANQIHLEDQIKNEQFFEGIDWTLLENGKLEPPFVPEKNTNYMNGFRCKKIAKVFKRRQQPNYPNADIYRKFNTGAVPVNWQKDIIDSELFKELKP